MKAVISKGSINPVTIRVPSSKSLTHRALIAAALADGPSVIYSPAMNQDTEATIEALKKLNVSIEISEDFMTVSGNADFAAYDGSVIDCRESGSTLRFLIPLFVHSGRLCRFSGQGKLMERPLTLYRDIYGKTGTFDLIDQILSVQGENDAPAYELAGNVSSQFISGLLFALPFEEHDSRIILIPPVESLSYIDMTIDVLAKAGISAARDGDVIFIAGRQKYQSFSCRIEGDDSQAAFFIAQAIMQKRTIMLEGISPVSRQADHVMVSLARQCGAEITERPEGIEITGRKAMPLCADLSDCPDLGPILFALAAATQGNSRFRNVSRLRLKESDRIAAMKQQLLKTGCRFEETDNEVVITGNKSLKGGWNFFGHNDHRIVMALSILASSSENPSVIEGIQAVSKSYPGFFEDLKATGTEVSIDD